MKSQRAATRPKVLKHALIEVGLTQRRLAALVRIDETRLSRIVSGKAFADKRERRAIAARVGREQSELFAVAS